MAGSMRKGRGNIEFNESLIAEHLKRTWIGAVLAAAQEESNESNHP